MKICYPKGTLVQPVDPDTGQPVPLAPMPIIPPYSSTRPPAAKGFYGHFRGVLAAGLGAEVILAPVGIPNLQVPNGSECVIERVTAGVLDGVAGLEVVIAIRANGASIPGLSALVPWDVTAAVSAVDVYPGTFLAGAILFDARAMNRTVAGPWDVRVDITGYYYSQTSRLGRFGDDEG